MFILPNVIPRSIGHRRDTMPVYTGTHTRNISFPLGGIGTGSIGLSGDGRLDWEILNGRIMAASARTRTLPSKRRTKEKPSTRA